MNQQPELPTLHKTTCPVCATSILTATTLYDLQDSIREFQRTICKCGWRESINTVCPKRQEDIDYDASRNPKTPTQNPPRPSQHNRPGSTRPNDGGADRLENERSQPKHDSRSHPESKRPTNHQPDRDNRGGSNPSRKSTEHRQVAGASKKRGQSKSINLHHIVWSPKYRRNIFKGRPGLVKSCEYYLRHICKLKGITIHAIAIETDHVHIFIEIPNTMSVSKAAMLMKWFSGRWLRREYTELQKYPKFNALWQRKYLSRSISGNAKSVRKYIEDQGVQTS